MNDPPLHSRAPRKKILTDRVTPATRLLFPSMTTDIESAKKEQKHSRGYNINVEYLGSIGIGNFQATKSGGVDKDSSCSSKRVCSTQSLRMQQVNQTSSPFLFSTMSNVVWT